jgi:hypothetical protein
MVQAIIDVPKRTNQVLNIIKAQFDLKDKSQAIAKVVQIYEDSFLDPELKPEFVAEMRHLETKGKFQKYSSLEDLESEL